ncbi:MAG: FkbM family methyltransferase [Gammaproteobacteria bacterium]|nr:MAG: FkbM family methyltransferase [Gammaproteobacteria bacterium]
MIALLRLRHLAFVEPMGKRERLGSAYGGWICDTSRLQSDDLAICAGAGEDITFDVELNARFGLRVVCVDPTPRSIAHVEAVVASSELDHAVAIDSGPRHYDMRGFARDRFFFVPKALWNSEGSIRLYEPTDPEHVSHSALNLQGTTSYIDVSATTIDVLVGCYAKSSGLALLKLDIEGAEYVVLDRLITSRCRPDQILVEFDELYRPRSLAAFRRVGTRIRALRKSGYFLSAVDNANFTFLRR